MSISTETNTTNATPATTTTTSTASLPPASFAANVIAPVIPPMTIGTTAPTATITPLLKPSDLKAEVQSWITDIEAELKQRKKLDAVLALVVAVFLLTVANFFRHLF